MNNNDGAEIRVFLLLIVMAILVVRLCTMRIKIEESIGYIKDYYNPIKETAKIGLIIETTIFPDGTTGVRKTIINDNEVHQETFYLDKNAIETDAWGIITKSTREYICR